MPLRTICVALFSGYLAFTLEPLAASGARQTAPAEPPTAIAPVRPGPDSWRYASEQEWIVSDIVSTLATLASRARPRPLGDVRVATLPPGTALARFRADAGDGSATIEIRDHIWAPANYVALAKRWIPARSTGAKPGPSSELLSQLVTPRVEVIERLNREVGLGLSANGLASEDHEAAALLLGVLALREGPGPFGDIRRLLSKMTAHLAIARAARAKPTPTREVAELVQLVLVNRQRDALERLTKWEAGSPSVAERSWIRALRIRVTGDWRLLERPRDASLLERIEYLRAVYGRLGLEAALDFIDDSHPEAAADWTRIIASTTMSVEAGKKFGAQAFSAELVEAAHVWGQDSGLVNRLNADVTTETEPRNVPIDWPTWAASFQRHLAMHSVTAVQHESTILRRKDVARQVAAKLEQIFGRLTLFPLAKLRYALDDVQYASAMKDVVALMLRHPDLLTSANWLAGLELRGGRAPTGVTPQSSWFTQVVPAGTAFDAAYRVYTYQRTNHLTRELAEKLRQLAPYEPYLLAEQMRLRFGTAVPFAELRREAGPLADYDSAVLRDLANAAKEDPATYVPVATRLCDLQADNCDSLGAYLADHDRDEEAAGVYQRWVDGARNRVRVSNYIDWLITYYDTHGQHERAVELADQAADVFSNRGLVAKARLLERMAKYQEAEDLLKQASERYGETIDLTAFYVRWSKATGDAGVKSAADSLLAKVFPRGLERFDTPAAAGPPADGVKVTTTGARGANAGFEIDDVVVAVDGLTVHNYDQFLLAWQMEAKPAIEFLTWKGGKYSTIRADIRNTWASGWFVGYRAPAPPAPGKSP